MTSQSLLSLQGTSGQYFGGFKTSVSSGQSNQWHSMSTTIASGQTASLLGTSGTLIVKPSDRIDDFVIHEDTGNLGTTNVGGKMTGAIQIENDSMMFAHFKVTDMISGEVLKDLPSGFFLTAFNPDLIGPQGGWTSGFWASTALYDAKFQSINLEIYTAGIKGGTWDEYYNGPSFALVSRNAFYSRGRTGYARYGRDISNSI